MYQNLISGLFTNPSKLDQYTKTRLKTQFSVSSCIYCKKLIYE